MIVSTSTNCSARRSRRREAAFGKPGQLHDRRVAGPSTDLRLNYGQCWLLVKALGSAHMTTDAKRVENLAGSTSKLSTAAEAAMFRRGMGVVSCLGSSELANRQELRGEKVHRRHSASAQGDARRW